MGRQPRPSELERRKQVRVRLRPHLTITPRPEEGQTYYVVRDPVTLGYYRLDDRQHYAVTLMDGTHTLAEIQQACEERFRPERLPLEELEAFAAQLVTSGLAQNETAGGGAFLFEQWQKHRRQVLWTTVANFLFLKVPLCDPDPFLDRWARRLRPLFGLGGLLPALGLALAALALVATHWDEFLDRLPTYRDLFTAHTLLYLWLAVGLAKLLHELGHGLCCKAQGGAVRELGLALVFFCPTLYCDVSDSWVLPGRRQRMAVAAAGVAVDLLVAAAATFLWWLTDPATLLHGLAFGLMVTCGVSTVAWNANPLMRFDGYYVLSDGLGVPNLFERSAHFLQATVLRGLGFDVPREAVRGRAQRLLFLGYAAAGTAYRAAMTAGVVAALYAFLEPRRLGVIAVGLGLAAAAALLGGPILAAVRAVRARGGLPEMRPARLWLAWGALTVLLVAFFALPLPTRVEGQALIEVEPDHLRRVVVPEAGGFVSEVLVRDGQAVRAGDVLAVLTNPQLEIKLRLNEADRALRSQQLSGETAYLAEGGGTADGPAGGTLQPELELQALVTEHALLREQRQRLTLRAPCDGRVMGLEADALKGKWLDKGAEVCRVGEAHALRAVLLIDPADHARVKVGGRAWVRVHGRGAACWPGTVAGLAQVEAGQVPRPLSSHAGGEAVTDQDPVSKAEKPRSQSYLVAVRLEQADPLGQPGVLGRVKVETPPQTAWWRLRRYLGRAFGWGL